VLRLVPSPTAKTEHAPGPRYEGRQTIFIRESLAACADSGHPEKAEPYATIMHGCADGARMGEQYTPWRKLGTTMGAVFGLIFGLAVGMMLGAGANPW
jgi:hypothetical protein